MADITKASTHCVRIQLEKAERYERMQLEKAEQERERAERDIGMYEIQSTMQLEIAKMFGRKSNDEEGPSNWIRNAT